MGEVSEFKRKQWREQVKRYISIPEPCLNCKGRGYLRQLDASGNWDESKECPVCNPPVTQPTPDPTPSELAKRIAEAVCWGRYLHECDRIMYNEITAEIISAAGLAELEAERDHYVAKNKPLNEHVKILQANTRDLEARLAAAEQDANQVKADYNLLHNASRDVYFYACDGLHITDERDVLCFARLNVILKGGERGHNPEVCVDVQEAYDKMKRERDEARGRLERIAQLVHGDGWHGLNAVTQDKVYRLATATDEGGSDESTKS